MKSQLSYLLLGPLTPQKEQPKHHAASVLHVSTQPVQEMGVFWTMESKAISPTSVDRDKEFMAEYQRTCIIHEADGSHTARFPWKPNHPPLPTNLTLCGKERRY